MNTFPALSDALPCEHRPDRNLPFPATLVMPNGSLVCAEDYMLCGVLAREVLEVSL